MAYSTQSDVDISLGNLPLPSSVNYAKYIARADAKINSALRNYFSVPLVSGEVNDDTWSLVNGYSADLAAAYLLRDLATVSQDNSLYQSVQEKKKDAELWIEGVLAGTEILAGATPQTDTDDDAVIPSILYDAPDDNSFFANKDPYNIERAARLGEENALDSVDPETDVVIID